MPCILVTPSIAFSNVDHVEPKSANFVRPVKALRSLDAGKTLTKSLILELTLSL